MTRSSPWIPAWWPALWSRWSRPALPLVVVSGLLCLGAANIATQATWQEVEDGVLWRAQAEGIVAAEVAPGTPAAAVGLRRGDLLLAIDDRPVQEVADVVAVLHASRNGRTLHYTTLRLGTREVIDVRVAPVPTGRGALYFVLAAVGIFTLLVGGAVRLRRPRDPATLHFFWLAVAFFGVFTFSFSGRLDRLDWVFYWADVISILALPPLFLHFTMVFPERPRRWSGGAAGHGIVLVAYAPAVALGLARIAAVLQSASDAAGFVRTTALLERLEFLYLAGCLIGGLGFLVRALSQVSTITARRQLRWIAWGTALGAGTFAIGYALPYALGVEPSLPMEFSVIPLSLIPLAYASAIVRYRLLDIEVIVKRALVYAAALAAMVVIYAVLLEAVGRVFLRGNDANQWVLAFLATLVAVLLAPPVKTFVQNMLDRAFYRDRYDYRRALVGFARDLNSDLDLNRLAERLVSRVVETLLVDRMALMLEDEVTPHFGSMRASGFGDGHPPALPKRSAVGTRVVERSQRRARRPDRGRPFPGRGDRVLARRGPLLLRALRREGRDHRRAGPWPEEQRRAAQQRRHGATGCRCRSDCHGARERAALSPAPREGRRDRSHARVQREHPRVARRRAAGRRPRRPRGAVEHGARPRSTA